MQATQALTEAGQSLAALHSTHVPAALPEPQTDPPFWLHDVPGARSVYDGASGEPEQVGSVWQSLLLGPGPLVGSSTDVVPPEPLQTTFWQVPAVCRAGGATDVPRSLVPHVPLTQVTVTHGLVVGGHSDALLQPTHVPAPSQNIALPVPQ